MRVLSMPFTFGKNFNGSLRKVEVDSNEYKAQQISAYCRTHLRERPIFQDFGIEDPTFQEFDESTFSADFSTFYPGITLVDIEVTEKGGAIRDVEISFS